MSNYDDPELRERLYQEILAGDRGGNPGQWSARKAQLLVREYKKNGGGYLSSPNRNQRSLIKWTNEKWGTRSGRPSLETGERYLPQKALQKLTDEEYEETSRKKWADMKKGIQFSKQPAKIREKVWGK